MQNKNLLLLKRADKIAQKSKDQSTKVGAFLMDADEISPLGFGYNGMPRGLPDDDPEKNQRPEKYLWFEHAERNAIYNSVQPLMQNSMILLTHFPNMEATRAIVSSGIDKIVVPSHDQNSEHYTRVLEMLKYSKVELVSLDDPNLNQKLKRKYKEDMEFTQEYAEDLASPFSPRPEGALILNQNTFAPIGMGESGPPPSLNIDADQIKEKGANFWIQEAAKNAIFNTVRPKLKNSHAFVSWCPCAQCALALASVGTKKVITYQPDFTNEADLRWKDHFEQTAKLFNTLNIELDLVTKDAMKNLLIEQAKKPKPRMR